MFRKGKHWDERFPQHHNTGKADVDISATGNGAGLAVPTLSNVRTSTSGRKTVQVERLQDADVLLPLQLQQCISVSAARVAPKQTISEGDCGWDDNNAAPADDIAIILQMLSTGDKFMKQSLADAGIYDSISDLIRLNTNAVKATTMRKYASATYICSTANFKSNASASSNTPPPPPVALTGNRPARLLAVLANLCRGDDGCKSFLLRADNTAVLCKAVKHEYGDCFCDLFAVEDVIGSHACSLEASMRVIQ
jgi:hypothetical protein